MLYCGCLGKVVLFYSYAPSSSYTFIFIVFLSLKAQLFYSFIYSLFFLISGVLAFQVQESVSPALPVLGR